MERGLGACVEKVENGVDTVVRVAVETRVGMGLETPIEREIGTSPTVGAVAGTEAVLAYNAVGGLTKDRAGGGVGAASCGVVSNASLDDSSAGVKSSSAINEGMGVVFAVAATAGTVGNANRKTKRVAVMRVLTLKETISLRFVFQMLY